MNQGPRKITMRQDHSGSLTLLCVMRWWRLSLRLTVGRKVRAIRHDYEKRKDAAGKPDPRYLKGRQILKIIYDHYKIADVNHRIKELEDIMSLRMTNNDLFKFHDEWLFCLLVQKIQPNWEFKLTRYYGQVKKHPDLEHDMATYHRFGQDNVKFGPGFTDHESDEHGRYEWLITCVDNLIDRKRENTHINNAAHGGPHSAYASPKKKPAKGKGKEGGKGQRECDFWMKGFCKKGAQCTYKHDDAKKGSASGGQPAAAPAARG